MKDALFTALATLAEKNISNMEMRLLLIVKAAPATCTVLSKHLKVTTGAITGLIDRLESRELIERVRDYTDRRSYQISITPQGSSLVDESLHTLTQG